MKSATAALVHINPRQRATQETTKGKKIGKRRDHGYYPEIIILELNLLLPRADIRRFLLAFPLFLSASYI